MQVRSSASEQAELKVSELQTQLEDVSQQLHQALSRIQVWSASIYIGAIWLCTCI